MTDPNEIAEVLTTALHQYRVTPAEAIHRLRTTAMNGRKMLRRQSLPWGSQQRSDLEFFAKLIGKSVEEIEVVACLAALLGTADYLRQLRRMRPR